MTRLVLLIIAALGLLLSSGCGYRIVAPPKLGESVAVRVAGNRSRLVRSQAYLQQEVGRAIRERLGWTVSPQGTASLELLILEETIDVAASDVDDIPTNWQITLRAQAVLITSDNGIAASAERQQELTGVGYAGSRLEEPRALRQAARNLAARAADWLEQVAEDWPHGDAEAQPNG